MITDKNSSSKKRHFYHCSASHSSHSIWLTWRNLHVYAHGTCKRKMECWNPGISLDFYIQANLLLFKAPTSQPRMIIFRMLSLGNWTAIVTSFHRNREYLRRRRSLGTREDFTFLHILKIFYLYILLQIYPEDLLPLKLNDSWKILSGKDKYLDELITQQKTEKLNQILSGAIGLSLTFGNLPEIITYPRTKSETDAW